MVPPAPTILIIDDEPSARQTLEALLANSGAFLDFAENGKIGMEKARKILPDAILLDVMMPGMDGYEVCRRLRADPTLAEIHIVMVTALDDRDARLAGFMAGADEFISKPFDGLELQLRMKTITRINRYRRLMAERTRFLWLVEHDDDGYLLLNSQGIIQYANASSQTLLHLPMHYNGLDFSAHVTNYYSPHPIETWNQWLEDPAPCYLVQPETATARALWLLLEAMDAPFGQNQNRVVHVKDVTEKLSISQDIRKFHSAITHKMRTPVALLVSSMSLVEAKLNVLTEAEIKDFVKTAVKGVNRLSDEVRDILTYIDAPLSIQRGIPMEIRALPQLVQTIQAQNKIKDLQLSIAPSLAECGMAINPYAFGLVLEELLENSCKFHPQQSPHVEIIVEPWEGGDSVDISIQDDGATLTAQQLLWARQPYQQGEKFFTGEIPGMGLGIPLVSTLVWQAGGQIRISNREGKTGILVQLNIPLQK